jgi:8-oxo-dGTP diphosphatase
MLKQCAGALVLDGGQILLGKRSPALTFYPDVWDLFGGHVEPGERPEQTLVRELQEELGISATRAFPLGVIQADVDIADPYECHLYAVMEWTGTPRNCASEEHVEICWFSLQEAAELDLAHQSYAGLFSALASGLPAGLQLQYLASAAVTLSTQAREVAR